MTLRKIAFLEKSGMGFVFVLFLSLAVLGTGLFALQDLPQEPFARGKALLLRGKPGDAKASFEAALAQNPKNLDIAYFRGVALLQLGNTDAARGEFCAILTEKSDYALGHAGLAQVWIKKANYPEAEKEIAMALSLDPKCTEAYYQRGVVQGYLKNTDAAIAAFEKGLEFDSLHAYAHYNLGLAYNQKKRKDLTIVHLEKFLTLAPLAPEAPQVRNFLNLLKR
ncbi:MAG: tetratricopeptide repeat protein [Candidatus Aminicenantes bacterium]|nr:tetratricopeptide repeat protein [Candidatus Aminicenantes bacterium]